MIKLFDKTFFRLAFLFILIILVSFTILIVAGNHELKDKTGERSNVELSTSTPLGA